MPYLKLQTNITIHKENKSSILSALSSLLSKTLEKSEDYVMCTLEENSAMIFAGTNSPAAFLQLASLGLSSDQTKNLSQVLCTWLQKNLGIPQERVYIKFDSPERSLWGWNGTTFG